MPKELREPPPSSSVARLFDAQAASRALTPLAHDDDHARRAPETARRTELPHGGPAVPERAAYDSQAASPVTSGIKREVVLSVATDETFTRLIELFRRSTGTRLSGSHVARAMLRGISTCFDSLQAEANEIGRLKLPSTARGREGERERFEARIAEAFINGIRAAAAYRRGG